MKQRFIKALRIAAAGIGTVAIPIISHAQIPSHPISVSPWVSPMQDEIERAMSLELPGMPRPHYIIATLIEQQEALVEASLGAVLQQHQDRSRVLKVEVRVGDRSFDNSNFLGGSPQAIVVWPAPLDDDPLCLRRLLWLAADRSYIGATESYEAKRAHREAMTIEQDRIDDFSASAAVRFRGSSAPVVPPLDRLSALATAASSVFSNHPKVYQSRVRMAVRSQARTLLDSENRVIEDSASLVEIEIVAQTQARDGMELSDRHAFASIHFDEIPTEETMVRWARELMVRLETMREAAIVQPYSGPVLFEGRASSRLFRTLLAEELSATPSPEPTEGQDTLGALATRKGFRILPVTFDVVDDPTVDRIAGLPAIGHYLFDDQGVRAQPVHVVKEGILDMLLSSRTPSKTVAISNGHGRAGWLGDARGRAANVWIRARDGLSRASLRNALLEAARKEGLDYGIIVAGFEESSGIEGTSFSLGRRDSQWPPSAEAYRLYRGGKLEPIRGLTIQGLRPRDLRRIVAAGADANVYSYRASANAVRAFNDSVGEIPTTIIAPSVLFPDVDVVGMAPPYPLVPAAAP
ncbi:MAG TPA: metallopeptidase TldD-related protein [Polyangiaceae bacterium]|jgi:predicted Zn-dependent protease|nr:MAG: putative modulator of DNA gyrase [Deltaproteobacteria bacterium ADurb.Bin207]HNS98011.1 metallopeptidase TldD-related protein [Polyangiaceae bacterium]HNZ24781.1 metallopeptidase TldD-related protein [Polyangiaceae bacterium]HOD25087.1 metallopeptidase TldD-related protein [Polyangiaceae bacterium]HOE50524.1 metallopeptidase TldD-related protein [Polyangiaceae bacterium]